MDSGHIASKFGLSDNTILSAHISSILSRCGYVSMNQIQREAPWGSISLEGEYYHVGSEVRTHSAASGREALCITVAET